MTLRNATLYCKNEQISSVPIRLRIMTSDAPSLKAPEPPTPDDPGADPLPLESHANKTLGTTITNLEATTATNKIGTPAPTPMIYHHPALNPDPTEVAEDPGPTAGTDHSSLPAPTTIREPGALVTTTPEATTVSGTKTTAVAAAHHHVPDNSI